MSAPLRPVVPLAAYHEALVRCGERVPGLAVVEADLGPDRSSSSFAARFPARYAGTSPREEELVAAAVERSREEGPVFVGAPVPLLLEGAYVGLVRSVIVPRRNVKLVGFPADAPARGGRTAPTARDDLGTMRALPSMTVVAPADGPTVHNATFALAEHEGPAYVRLPVPTAPPVTDGSFALGRANEVRPGSDLTIVALGAMLSRAVDVAKELAGVGISVRVLDVASVKPFDEAAILRAARETGAILVAEAAPLATGIGELVAAMTAENHPVPVRRLGLPDVWSPGNDVDRVESGALSLERLRDEAWELLRLRGKAT